MKKIFLPILVLITVTTAVSQVPTYQQKLYYTCKVWGMVKYYHSRVSVGMVNWDTALMHTLPLIKNAVTSGDFNDALDTLLLAAGPMAIDSTPSPDTLPPMLKRNLRFEWINDPLLRNDIRGILDTIKTGFRPHPISWVIVDNSFTGSGYLNFPYDDPMLFGNASLNYPGEFTRLLILFKYWNIINYFNPHNYALDHSWDSTLFNYVIPFATAPDYYDFFRTIKKLTSNLDDAHVGGMTWSSVYYFPGYFGLRFVLRYMQGDYVVVKSGISGVSEGDIIMSVNGKTTSQMEDSLRQYISAGNPTVLRRFMSQQLLVGQYGTVAEIMYKDSLGSEHSVTGTREDNVYSAWFTSYAPNDSLVNVKWKKWACNVGYVNMGEMTDEDVDTMYNDLRNTSAIIFDIRKASAEMPTGNIADLIYPGELLYAKILLPDVHYPGTSYWEYQSAGVTGNPEPYAGKVIILCNEQTQSSMEHICMILRAMPGSVIVGSQTAGADGSVSIFHLSDDIQTAFTSMAVYFPDGDSVQRVGIATDSVVSLTSAGIRQGRDEILEKALQTAGCLVPIFSVTPAVHAVPAGSGSAAFVITTNTNWSAVSDASWCTLNNSSGSGNATLIAEYTENTAYQERSVHIIIYATGLPPDTVSIVQAKSTIGIGEKGKEYYPIFPNPASGSFRITADRMESSELEISLHDVSGKKVLEKRCTGGKEYVIDIPTLVRGCYYVRIRSANSFTVHKLIIL